MSDHAVPGTDGEAPLRVLFDLSVVGLAESAERARTGVYRVVSQTAHRLAERTDVDVFWSAVADYQNHQALAGAIHAGTLAGTPIAGRELLKPAPGMETVARLADWNDRIGALGFGLGRLTEPLRRILRGRMRRPQWRPSEVASFDVVHLPYHEWPGGKRRSSTPGGDGRQPARVFTVYDLIPWRHPEWFSMGEPERFRRGLAAIRPGDGVVVNADSTRRDLLEARPDLDAGSIEVLPLGVSDLFQPCSQTEKITAFRDRVKIGRDDRYLLSLCTLEPRKNLPTLIRAFERLCDGGDRQTHLVLVGAKGWGDDPVPDDLDPRVADRIHLPGFIADEDLSAVYTGASAFVYLSRYEGFGLPPLEAMACGTPVVVSDNSSLPEVVGDAGRLVPADDLSQIVDAIRSIFDDDRFAEELSRRGRERAADYTWERHVDGLINFYRRLVRP